ncbi:MAG TPA: hypothetical protein VH881_05040 [Burkholderiales bacterium]
MKATSFVAAAIIILAVHAEPAVAGGGAGHQAHAAPSPQHRAHQQPSRQAHTHFGSPRLEQRADPNYQNPYRPMYSLGATNPDGTHPYFQTRKEGFGYPPAQPAPVYLGNGVYVIPR